MKTISIILTGAVILTAGCNLAPSYRRPETATSDRFKEGVQPDGKTADGWKTAEPHDAGLGGKWWELYHDPQLSELEERVAISNQTVIAAEANYRAARALVAGARAGLFPTLGVSPSVTRSRSSASGGSGGGASSSSTTNNAGSTRTLYDLPLEASYEVDLWGRVRNTIAQDAYAAQASAADVATALLGTQAELAQDYFQLRVVDEQRRILDTTLADYRASLHLVNVLFGNGMSSEEDLAQATTQLDSAQAQATDLGIARGQYEHAIAVLIGVSPSQFSLPVQPFNPALPQIPVGLPSDLLERRPDIAAAERQVAAANAGIGIARTAYFPSLSLSASAGYEASSLAHLLDWPNRFWSVGPVLAETLFDGGARNAATARARAQYDGAVANYRQTVLSAFQSVEDNLTSLRILSLESVQQHGAAVAAQNLVRLSVARYQSGLDSYVNVITAQNTFLTSRQAELQVQLRQLAATIGLINNLGGGWDTSQFDRTEKMAQHPPDVDKPAGPAPGTAGPGVPNPPPLTNSDIQPADLLKQNEQSMGRTPAP
jgi:NodT family efflux transporter outer membrane factor (OMF) lipoprotein